jgi:hypothetical protein
LPASRKQLPLCIPEKTEKIEKNTNLKSVQQKPIEKIQKKVQETRKNQKKYQKKISRQTTNRPGLKLKEVT